MEELPVNNQVRRGVQLMTFKVMDGATKEIAKKRYYMEMLDKACK